MENMPSTMRGNSRFLFVVFDEISVVTSFSKGNITTLSVKYL
jgi:hypothetical protein